MNATGIPPDHGLTKLGRAGLATLQEWLAQSERTAARQRELVSQARKLVIVYDVDTVADLPADARDRLIDQWRAVT
ncbi:MAG: hypothetical protein ACRD0W_00615 [Acidimicrobiales bacterium]